MIFTVSFYTLQIRIFTKSDTVMARNTGTGARKGAVSGRSQVYNPATGNYIKRDTETGRFLDVKSDGKPFK